MYNWQPKIHPSLSKEHSQERLGIPHYNIIIIIAQINSKTLVFHGLFWDTQSVDHSMENLMRLLERR